ncbi:MAG: hypothetical protein JWM54_486 [Acidobacteriaceae bacterium]|nr:hypothetical protein [Acidobacteriaceae bacterium]
MKCMAEWAVCGAATITVYEEVTPDMKQLDWLCSQASPPHRPGIYRVLVLGWLGLAFVISARAADTKAGMDVITFVNGDQLTGTLLSESDRTVMFHSDMSGDMKVSWDKIKSLHTSEAFAVIRSSEKLRVGRPAPQVPVGPLHVSNDEVSVSGPGGEVKNIPAKDAAYLVNGEKFEKALMHEPGLRQGWEGALTLGASLVQSTQTSRSFNGSLGLVRAMPGVDWLAPRNKTIFNANASYGSVTEPAIGTTPASSAKTNILHGDIERDEYVTQRLYVLGDASADHNIGSGLRVQQDYGGGVGYSFIREETRTLDLKGDIHYERQEFYPPGVSQNLIGASIGEIYMEKLGRGLVLNQTGVVQPAFNNASAFTAQLIAGLVFPVYKNLGFTLGTQDNYINNPPAGYKNNTFQFTAGVTYSLK